METPRIEGNVLQEEDLKSKMHDIFSLLRKNKEEPSFKEEAPKSRQQL